MAQITINIPDVHVPRILAALNASNAAEAKDRVIDFLKISVINHENQVLIDQQTAQIGTDLTNVPIT
jgi:hypothetical protein